ncbi:MAG: ABC transporter ATP-binding protein [Oscillospiraceae bacterium]|jgi:iron complex transport system ATP-binding protein|nr:ABC transporter ATP-binding protein [Oscillospiraceae bacterium]
MLEVRELVCGYRAGSPVVGPVSFRLERGEVLCLLGPNGVGKTTLLKTILGVLPPLGGAAMLKGRDVGSYGIRAFAREAAYVPQGHVPPFPYTARDVVAMGRSPHIHEFSSPGRKDLRAAEDALAELGILSLADRDYTRLSGGERQLVLIARALAQEAELLVLDEPAAHLDYGNEARVMEQVKGLSRKGYGVLLVTHGPGQAFLWADQAAAVGRDGFFAAGKPEEVLTEETLSRLYGADVQLAEAALRDGRRVKVCVCVSGRTEANG